MNLCIITRTSFSTKPFHASKSQLIDALVSAIFNLLEQKGLHSSDVLGVGIGLPGLIDPIKGVVNFLPNIPGWKNVPLKKILEKKLRIKTYLENDANLIALGEWKHGAGAGVKNMVCLTLGTGVGGGLILNNALYRGEGFCAGEIGHMPLNEHGPSCGCGGYGCFERYVGNRYLLKEAEKVFKKKSIDFPEIRQLSRQGNAKTPAFWKSMADKIGNGLVGIVNLLNPAVIVIGGGVSHNYQYLFPEIRKVINKRAMKIPAKMVKIVRAKLGDNAGIAGAQVLVEFESKLKT